MCMSGLLPPQESASREACSWKAVGRVVGKEEGETGDQWRLRWWESRLHSEPRRTLAGPLRDRLAHWKRFFWTGNVPTSHTNMKHAGVWHHLFLYDAPLPLQQLFAQCRFSLCIYNLTRNQYASPPRGNAIPAGPLSDSGEVLCRWWIPKSSVLLSKILTLSV